MIELKNSIENFSDRLGQAEKTLNELKNRSTEITQSEERKKEKERKRTKWHEKILWDLQTP